MMLGRTAVLGTTLGLAGASALVVVPSAKIEVDGASRGVTATVTATVARAGARRFDPGEVSAPVTVPATGRLAPVKATGTVEMEFSYPTNPLQGFGEGVQRFLGCMFTGGSSPICKPTPVPSPLPTTPRITLPAGTRLHACPPNMGISDLDCTDVQSLVTTQPVTVILGQPAIAVPVRAAVPGPNGNVSEFATVWFVNPPPSPAPQAAVFVYLNTPISGGAFPHGPAIAAADIAKAAAKAPQLRAQLQAQLSDEVKAGVLPGEELATPLGPGNVASVPASTPGDAGSEATVYATLDEPAVAVSTANLHQIALDALQNAAPHSHVFPGSVRWDPPVAHWTSSGDPTTVTFTAHGLASDLDAATLRGAAAWHGSGHLTDVVRQSAPRATVTVQRGFGWSPALVFLDRRATVTVDGYALN